MAGRPKKPIALHIANGNPSKLTDEEIEERMQTELQVPFKDVTPPDYLSAAQKKEFVAIASRLVELNIMTELDTDVLAQYCIAKTLYLDYSDQLKKVLAKKNAVHKWAVIDKIAASCEDEEDMRKLLEAILRRQRGDDASALMSLQDRAFKQCLACAKELGLTITSRAKMVVPKAPEEDEEL